MALFFSVLGLVLLLVFHELGHAAKMRKHGVEIAEFGIGFPIPGLPALRIKSRSGTIFCLHLFLVGAYVKPSEAGTECLGKLPAQAQKEIYLAGIAVNATLGGALLVIGSILAPPVATVVKAPEEPTDWGTLSMVLVLSVVARLFKINLKRTIGLTLLFLILLQGIEGTVANEYINIGAILESLIKAAGTASGLISSLGVLSLSLAIMNLLPVPPMDGWRISRIREEKEPEPKMDHFDIGMLAGLLVVMGYGFIHDLILCVIRIIR
jgi:membrane-associated protease RseP (regulator of RpoE activity)